MRVEVLRPYFLLTLLGGALVLAVFILKPFLAPLTLAAVFAVVFQPVFNRLLKKMGGRRGLAAFGTMLVFLICIVVPIGLVTSQIVLEASSLSGTFTGGEGVAYIDATARGLAMWLGDLVPGLTINYETFVADFEVYAQQGLQIIVSHLGGILSSITGLFLSAFIFFIAFFYLLKEGATLKHTLIELSPLVDTDDELIFRRLERAVNSVVRGNLMLAVIQGAVATTGFFFFGVPNAVLWGTVTAIAALIPAVGTALVLVPAVLFLLFTGAVGPALGLAIWGIAAVGLVDNILGPKLVGRNSGLHPLLILLSVLGGLTLFGPIGLFLGPLSLSLLFALLTIHAEVSKNA